MKIFLIYFAICSMALSDEAVISWETYIDGIPAELEPRSSSLYFYYLRPQIIYWNGIEIGRGRKGLIELEAKINQFKGNVIRYEYLDKTRGDYLNKNPLIAHGTFEKLSTIFKENKITFILDYE